MENRPNRISAYCNSKVKKRLNQIANTRGVSMSTLLEGIIEDHLVEREQGPENLKEFIGRVENRLKNVRLDIEVLSELLSLFVFQWLCYTPTIPDGQKEAVFLEGKERHKKFLKLLASRLERGEISVGELFASDHAQEPKAKLSAHIDVDNFDFDPN